MRGLLRRKTVSLALVLCMIVSSVVVLFSATAAAGTVYQTPVRYVDGNETMQNLGRSVAIIDLNADNITDLVAGAPYTTAGGLSNAGSVTVYLSEAGVAMAKVIVMNGTHTEDLFGWSVANVGDINGDGRNDLAIGAPLADPAGTSDAGSITLMYGWTGFDGSSNATISGLNAGEELGFSLAAAGDVNGDGKNDMLSGAPYYSSATLTGAGRAYLFYGGDPPDSVPDMTWIGQVGGAHLGWSIAGGGSVDADADLDMIVGAPGQGGSGAAYIVRDLSKMNPTVTVAIGGSADENFSFSVSMVPDINNDTITDLAIGAPTNNDNGTHAGAVYVLYGGSKFNTVADLILHGAPNEWFGWSVACGDFHEDGVSDLLVGAPNSNLNASSSGRAYAYFGGPSPSGSPSMTMVPDAGASFFGASLATGRNMTGDMAPDFVVGDPLFNVPGTPNAGRVYVYAGTHIIIPANPVVRGYVYVPGTTQGMQGFTVTLESPALNKSTTTNSAGYFQMTAIPGIFWLNASMEGYVSNSSTVTLAMNDDLTVPPFYPLRTPFVTGVVRDAVSGALLRGVTVAMYNDSTLAQEMTTGTNGTYWFWLPDVLVSPLGSATDIVLDAWDDSHYVSVSNISLARNQTVWENFTLDRFPVIYGSVREALFLSAVRGALVQANQGPTILATTTTDIRGLYSLVATNATPGQAMFVNVTAAGYFKTNQSVIVDRSGSYALNFILQRDNTPPVSQLGALPQYTTTPTVTLTASTTDANGIQEVQLWYRMGSAGDYAMYATDYASPFEFEFDPSAAGGDGLYSFYSIAVDYAGNAEAAPAGNDSWTFADSHPPATSMLKPLPGQLCGTTAVIAEWMSNDSGSGVMRLEVQLDSTGWIDTHLTPLHMFTSVSDGMHNISVRATDRAGLFSVSTVDFQVDTTGPSSSLDSLHQVTPIGSFTVTGNASDISGIEEVQLWYRHGGSGSYECLAIDDMAPYTFDVDTSTLDGDGLYEFYTLAIDNAHNNETVPADNGTWTTVDTTPPTVTIGTPSEGSTAGSATVDVAWTGEDVASGIAGYEVMLDGGAWVAIGLGTEHSFIDVADGNHTVHVKAIDNAGHESTASSVFTVDTIAPNLTITSPENNSAFTGYAVTVTWSAQDVGSGIQSLWVSKDGSSWEQIPPGSTYYDFSGASMNAEGRYTLYVRAVDEGGLSGISFVEVMIDRTPPTVLITSPLSHAKIGRTNATVRWVMSDAVSGVNTVQISVDGGAFMDIGTASSRELTDLAAGEHNVTLKVFDRAGNVRQASVTFIVSTGGGISAVMGAGIALVAIIAVVAIALLMRRRRPGLAEPAKKEGKS
jgi:hypothetical protein